MALRELRVGFRSAMTDVEDDILLLGRRVESMVGRVSEWIATPAPEGGAGYPPR